VNAVDLYVRNLGTRCVLTQFSPTNGKIGPGSERRDLRTVNPSVRVQELTFAVPLLGLGGELISHQEWTVVAMTGANSIDAD
jgi:hypothetical protein